MCLLEVLEVNKFVCQQVDEHKLADKKSFWK